MEPETSSTESYRHSDVQSRTEALQQLARAARVGQDMPPGSPSAADARKSALGLNPWRSGRGWRPWLAVGLVVVVVAATFAVVYLRPKPHQTVTAPAHPVIITPVSDDLDCLRDMAWSSDLHMIAMVGYAAGCPLALHPYDVGYMEIAPLLYQGPLVRGNDGSGVVAIYDAQHGVRINTFAPDNIVYKAILSQEPVTPAFTAWLAQADQSPPGNFAINYTHILWRSGNQKLILVFNFYLPDGAPVTGASGKVLPGHIIQGLLITDLAGQHTQILLQAGGQQAAGAIVWDLTTGRAAGTTTPYTPFASQPPALTYSWASSGALLEGSLLTSSSIPAAPVTGSVGAPLAGAPSFSAWQSGSIATTLTPKAPGPYLRNAVTFTTDFAAFSPDNRYLVTSIALAGLVIAAQGATDPTLSNEKLALYGWQAAPRLPLRDPGFRAAIALAEANSDQSSGPAAYVAWRPDGRVIAVSAFTTSGVLKLYDTSTGKQIGSLVPPNVALNGAGLLGGLLMWSSDGRSLAYYDGSTISLWSGALLPTQ